MLRALTKIAICVVIGAGLGYFTAYQWSKCQKKKEWKAIETKKLVTKDDVQILNWSKKSCK